MTQIESILRDFKDEKGAVQYYGDRRQEIVFIGVNLDETGITNLLDEALVTEEEWAGY